VNQYCQQAYCKTIFKIGVIQATKREKKQGSIMTKNTEIKLSVMSDERIAELLNFKTKEFTDFPV